MHRLLAAVVPNITHPISNRIALRNVHKYSEDPERIETTRNCLQNGFENYPHCTESARRNQNLPARVIGFGNG